jgi:hypothetical protein
MPQHPFPDPDPDPDPGPDGQEPDGSPLPPAAAEEGPDEDGPELGQGLYVCLPAEQVTLEGFAQHGEADTMAPGPLLAAIVDTVTGHLKTPLIPVTRGPRDHPLACRPNRQSPVYPIWPRRPGLAWLWGPWPAVTDAFIVGYLVFWSRRKR